MSNMLEQAIVDAQALKEAAIKNAESSLVEKYSEDIKNAVTKLLEQDEFEDEGFGMETGSEEGGAETSVDDQLHGAHLEQGEPMCPCPEKVDIDLDQLAQMVDDKASSLEGDTAAPPAEEEELFEVKQEDLSELLDDDVELEESFLQGLLEVGAEEETGVDADSAYISPPSTEVSSANKINEPDTPEPCAAVLLSLKPKHET